MVDLVLRQHVTTRDPLVASRAVESVFGTGTVTTDGSDFVFEARSLIDDGISVCRFASRGRDVRLSGSGSPDLVVVLVRSGELRLAAGGDRVRLGPEDLGLIPFAGAIDLDWDDVSAELFVFPLASFGRVLGAPTRRIAVNAPLLTPQSEELAGLWRRIAAVVLSQVLDKAELYQRDVVRAQLVDALSSVTVETFALVNTDEVGESLEDDAFRRAESYMRSRLGEPVAVLDVAASSGMSVRGLQGLYQRRLGVTPVARLRVLRLEAARAALRSPGAGATVGAVARRFGYSNLGRFSAHYRDLWDEQPSQTLEAARSGGTQPPGGTVPNAG